MVFICGGNSLILIRDLDVADVVWYAVGRGLLQKFFEVIGPSVKRFCSFIVRRSRNSSISEDGQVLSGRAETTRDENLESNQ